MCIKIDKILYVAFFYPKYTKWEGSPIRIKNSCFFFFQNHPIAQVSHDKITCIFCIENKTNYLIFFQPPSYFF